MKVFGVKTHELLIAWKTMLRHPGWADCDSNNIEFLKDDPKLKDTTI